MTDLQDMLCADALATSRSSLERLTLFHSRATKLFGVRTCTGTANPFDVAPALSMVVRTRRENGTEVWGLPFDIASTLGSLLDSGQPIRPLYQQ